MEAYVVSLGSSWSWLWSNSRSLLRVLVGPEYREFVVHRELLCASSAFFRDSIDAVPRGLSSSPPSKHQAIIWLAGESADVFELFVVWLYRRHAFRAVVEDAVTILAREASPDEVLRLLPERGEEENDEDNEDEDASPASRNLSDLHWHLVRLHLFAALINVPVLQDAVMDALQDLYLRFDWPATPALLRFLYTDADPEAACRLRKWAVALLAWTRANGLCAPELAALARLPALREEYAAHRSKMLASHADARIKNPQLRLPSNQLRRHDRSFGFRQCSFHSHRRLAGEGRCPHEQARKQHAKDLLVLPVDVPPSLRSPTSSLSSASGEPRPEDLPVWSPLSVTTPGYAPLGMESTI